MNYDALLVGSVPNSGSWTPQQLGSMTIALGSLSSELHLRDWSVPAQPFGLNSLEAGSAVSVASILQPLAMGAPSQHQQQQHTKHPNQLHQQQHLMGPTAGGSTAFPVSHAHAQLPFSPTKVSGGTSHGGMGASHAHSSQAHASLAHSFSAEGSLLEMLPLGAQADRLRQLQAEVVSSSHRYFHTCIRARTCTRHACTHTRMHARTHTHEHL